MKSLPASRNLMWVGIVGLLLLSRQLNQDWHLWYLEMIRLLSVMAILWVASRLPVFLRHIAMGCLIGYALGLALLTVYAGLSQLVNGLSYDRVKLFLPNANILAATLVVAFISLSVFYRRTWLIYSLCLTMLAVLLTGSRAALVALLVSSLMVLVNHRHVKRNAIAMALLLLVGIVLTIAVWQLSLNKLPVSERNLLRASGNFAEAYWKRHASSIQLLPEAVPSPQNNALADHLIARSGDKKVVILQLAEVSKPEQHYVGSLYLRADQPQEVVLFALGRVTCQVTSEWQRCVTPPTPGNGRSRAQLRLETTAPNQEIDIYIWGAQLEYDALSDLVLQDPSLDNYVQRFAVSLWSEDNGLSIRQEVALAAWKMFLENPWAGVGEYQFSPTLQGMAGDNKALARITHAHNFPLHVLATQGLTGFLATLVLFVITVIPLRKHWPKLLPFWVALILLNMTDFTFYSGSVFYVYWTTLGLLINSRN